MRWSLDPKYEMKIARKLVFVLNWCLYKVVYPTEEREVLGSFNNVVSILFPMTLEVSWTWYLPNFRFQLFSITI
jgi:hypothetical protein